MAPSAFMSAGTVLWNPVVGWPSTQTLTESHLPSGTAVGDRLFMVITYRTQILSPQDGQNDIVFTPLENDDGAWRFIETGSGYYYDSMGIRVYTGIYSEGLLPVTITPYSLYHDQPYYGMAGLGSYYDVFENNDLFIWTVQLLRFSPASTHSFDSVGLPYPADYGNNYASGIYNPESPSTSDGNPYNLTVPWFDINRRTAVGDGNSASDGAENIPPYYAPDLAGTIPPNDPPPGGSDRQRWKVNINSGTLVAIAFRSLGPFGTGTGGFGQYGPFVESIFGFDYGLGFGERYVRGQLTDSYGRNNGMMLRVATKTVTGYPDYGEDTNTLYRGPYWNAPESTVNAFCVLLALDDGVPTFNSGWHVGQMSS